MRKRKTAIRPPRILAVLAGGGSALCLLGIVASLVLMLGADYYVATDGNNAAAGTSPNAPWATPGEYFDLATFADGDVVWIKAGNYTAQDSYESGTFHWKIHPALEPNLVAAGTKTFAFIAYGTEPNDDAGEANFACPNCPYFVEFSGSATYAGTLKFVVKNVNFTGGPAATAAIISNTGTGVNAEASVKFENCAFTPGITGVKLAGTATYTAASTPTRTFEAVDCNFMFGGGGGTPWFNQAYAAVTLTDCTIALPTDANMEIFTLPVNAGQFTMTGCTVTGGKNLLTSVDPNNTGITRDLTLTDCTFTQTYVPTLAYTILAPTGWQSVTLDGCVVSGDPNDSTGLSLNGYQQYVSVRDCAFTTGTGVITNPAFTVKNISDTWSKFTARSSQFTNRYTSLALSQGFKAADVIDCNFSAALNAASNISVVNFGESFCDPNQHLYIPNGRFVGNRLTLLPTTRSIHGAYWATRSTNWEIAFNRFTELPPLASDPNQDIGGYGFVVKAERANVHHNVIYFGVPIIVEGRRSAYTHNTLISSGYGEDGYKRGLMLYAPPQAADPNKHYGIDPNEFVPTDNLIQWNIIDGSRGQMAWSSSTSSGVTVNDWRNRFDNNCYLAGSAGLASEQGNVTVNLDAADPNGMQYVWASTTLGTGGDAVSALFPLNDAHSVEVDPKFWDPNDGVRDFRVMRNSPLIDNDPNRPRMGTTCGAEQGTGTLTVNSGAGAPGRIPF